MKNTLKLTELNKREMSRIIGGKDTCKCTCGCQCNGDTPLADVRNDAAISGAVGGRDVPDPVPC